MIQNIINKASKRGALTLGAGVAAVQKVTEGIDPQIIIDAGNALTALITGVMGDWSEFLVSMNTVYLAIMAWASGIMKGHTEEPAIKS